MILILGCGGTIGMVPNAQGILEPTKSIEDIVGYVPTIAQVAQLELKQIEDRDSTELNPSHWTRFAILIADAIASGKYDGIIVTHGTDPTISMLMICMRALFFSQISCPHSFVK